MINCRVEACDDIFSEIPEEEKKVIRELLEEIGYIPEAIWEDYTEYGVACFTCSSKSGHIRSLRINHDYSGDILHIPENIDNLQFLEEFILEYGKGGPLPESFGNLKHLRKLEIDCFFDPPPTLKNLVNLTHLLIIDSSLEVVPDWIASLPKIKHLDLSHNKIREIPPFVERMVALEVLALSNNPISDIQTLRNTRFTSLFLHETPISEIPAWLSTRTNLKELILTRTNISPSELEKLTPLHGLEWLELEHLNLHTVPACLKNMTRLKHLNLSCNKIRTLPKWFAGLKHLVHLDLSVNQLDCTSLSILGDLPHLETLKIVNNPLGGLPSSWQNLKALTTLNLTLTDLSVFPEVLTALNLKTLNLRSNNLRSFPTSITEIKTLEKLTLYGNSIGAIPGILPPMPNLKVLDLDSTHLSKEPAPNFEFAPNLVELRLTNNDLGHVPESIRHLEGLQNLRLQGIGLSSLPAWFKNLRNLEELDLANNAFTDFPPVLLSLEKLRDLSLSDNQISQVPSKISALKNLIYLDLADNPIARLPNSMVALTNLRHLRGIRKQIANPEIFEKMPWIRWK